MDRYILRFDGTGDPDAADLRRITEIDQLRVIDSSPRMLLVEASRESLQTLLQTLPTWSMTQERIVRLPDPRPRLRKRE